jgi:hypothetical protein
MEDAEQHRMRETIYERAIHSIGAVRTVIIVFVSKFRKPWTVKIDFFRFACLAASLRGLNHIAIICM